MSTNIVWHHHSVTRTERQKLNGHNGVILWFTGLSGSGKSTLANALDHALHQQGKHSYVLDGDNIRHGLCKDLGFSDTDRTENIRRISEVAKLFTDAGLIVSTAFISPFRADRDLARSLVAEGACAIVLTTAERARDLAQIDFKEYVESLTSLLTHTYASGAGFAVSRAPIRPSASIA